MTNTPNSAEAQRWANNQQIIEEFRSNAGKVVGREESPLVLLHTKGAKSGQERINPVSSMTKDGVLYVFASHAGGPTNPDWYHNLVANPDVTVEYGSETFEARASVLTGNERDRVYAERTAIAQRFADYQLKTARKIPVIALHRK